MKLLILGGTVEARHLTKALGARAVLSLAGVTREPLPTPHRVGGFGGVEGLMAYLEREGFQGIIDATHPFAVQMSANAFAASTALGLPLLRLQRPPWINVPTWVDASDLTAAAAAIPAQARVFLTVGSRSLGPFLGRPDVWFLSRSIEPALNTPANGTEILQRPPFTLRSELALMKSHCITHLVCKNAGGAATQAKLEAAAKLGITVIMVQRPRLPSVLTVETVAEAIKWGENLGE